jgi:hypothetical protein
MNWLVTMEMNMTHVLAVDADTADEARRIALELTVGREPERSVLTVEVERGVR